MKNTILILILALFTTLSFAQVSDSQFLGLKSYGHNWNYKQLIDQTNKILDIAEEIASAKGVHVTRSSLKDKQGQVYPIIVIGSSGSSSQNKEAARITRTMNGLPLIFSPWDLRNDTAAFFKPDGSVIGVPYEFFTEGVSATSYQHELYHAETYQKIIAGKKTDWAGVMQAVKGFYISAMNNNSYFRFVSLDEIAATAFSIKIEIQQLAELKRTLTPFEYNKSRGEADNILREIHGNAEAGKYLSLQLVDVTTRALSQINKVSINQIPFTLGKSTKTIYEISFSLESYSHEASRSRNPQEFAIPDGLSFKMYSSSKPTTQEITRRLQNIRTKALASEKIFLDVIKNIHIKILYTQIETTDVRALERVGSHPFNIFKE